MRLAGLLTDEQMRQMAELLRGIMESGYGELEIVVVRGKVRFFRPQLSIAACYEEEDV